MHLRPFSTPPALVLLCAPLAAHVAPPACAAEIDRADALAQGSNRSGKTLDARR